MKAAFPLLCHAEQSEASQPSLKPPSFRIFLPGFILLTSCLLLFCSHKRSNPLDPTLNKAPNAPSNPYPAIGAANQGVDVTLSWDCSDPNAGDTLKFDVYFGTSNPPSTAVATSQAAKSLARGGLSYNATYYWKVVTRDNHGAETQGAVWSFATGSVPNNSPNMPGNPSPPNGATGQLSSLTLSWTGGDPDPGDTAKYDVYFDTSNPPSTRVAQDLVPTSLARTNLNSGTTYYWQIISKDRRGAVTTGSVWTFQTRSLPGAPSLISPTNGSVGVPTNPTTFVWGREALLKTTDLPVILPVPLPAPAPVTVSSAVLAGFAALKSANNDGEVSRPVHRLPADSRSVGHSDAQVPALLLPVSLPPRVLAITYQIQVATDTGFVNRVVDQSSLTDTTYSTNVLSLATTYYWRVQARDSGFIGPWSGRFSFMTDQAPNVPSNPSPPDGAMNQPISLTLSWSGGDPDPGDTARYDIYFDTVNPPVTRVSTGQLGTTLFRGGLNVNTTFYWKIGDELSNLVDIFAIAGD
jgi:hypothetical protein